MVRLNFVPDAVNAQEIWVGRRHTIIGRQESRRSLSVKLLSESTLPQFPALASGWLRFAQGQDRLSADS